MREFEVVGLKQGNLEEQLNQSNPLVLLIDPNFDLLASDERRTMLYHELVDHVLIIQKDAGLFFVMMMEPAFNRAVTNHPLSEAFINKYRTTPLTQYDESGIKFTGHLRTATTEEMLWENDSIIFVPSTQLTHTQKRYAEIYGPEIGHICENHSYLLPRHWQIEPLEELAYSH